MTDLLPSSIGLPRHVGLSRHICLTGNVCLAGDIGLLAGYIGLLAICGPWVCKHVFNQSIQNMKRGVARTLLWRAAEGLVPVLIVRHGRRGSGLEVSVGRGVRVN